MDRVTIAGVLSDILRMNYTLDNLLKEHDLIVEELPKCRGHISYRWLLSELEKVDRLIVSEYKKYIDNSNLEWDLTLRD